MLSRPLKRLTLRFVSSVVFFLFDPPASDRWDSFRASISESSEFLESLVIRRRDFDLDFPSDGLERFCFFFSFSVSEDVLSEFDEVLSQFLFVSYLTSLPFCDFFESDSAPESEDDNHLGDFELRLVTGVLNAEPAVGDGVLRSS
jgi:hypothetical protein